MEEKIKDLLNEVKGLTGKEDGMSATETSRCLDAYQELVGILMDERQSYEATLNDQSEKYSKDTASLAEERDKYQEWWRQDREELYKQIKKQSRVAARVRDLSVVLLEMAKDELGDDFGKAYNEI